jgi:hypothetical protein
MSNIQYSISNIQVGEAEQPIFAQRRRDAEEFSMGGGVGRMLGGETNWKGQECSCAFDGFFRWSKAEKR